MLSQPYQPLVSEATQHGTAEVLRRMPAEYSLELEQSIRHGVRQAVLYYAAGQASLVQEPPHLDQRQKACA